MRAFAIIFLIACVAFSCVKPNTKDPVPALEFKGIKSPAGSFWPSYVPKSLVRLPASSMPERDTASLVISYQDGDGDLFRNSSSDGPNFIFITYYWSADSNKFVQDFLITQTVVQPSNGYYKGKSVQGDIEVPLREFRSSNAHKILKFEGFMIDMQDHKSNTVTSPTYTLEF